MSGLVVFGGSSNQPLFQEICQRLAVEPGKAEIAKFPDGETKVEIGENVRGKDVFVIQSTSPPVNDNLVELLVMIDSLKRASAERVTAVVPYYGYGRQDRKHKGRVPISARLVADLLEAAGVDRVLTFDLHTGQIQGFFKVPVDHLPAWLAFAEDFQKDNREFTVVAPDAGSIKRARGLAGRLGAPLAYIDKRRRDEQKTEVIKIVGKEDVEGRVALLVDDIVSTGGTLRQDVEVIGEAGAEDIAACISHCICAPGASELLDESCLSELHITDSIPLEGSFRESFKLPSRVRVISHSIASLFAQAIQRIHENRSVSEVIEHT